MHLNTYACSQSPPHSNAPSVFLKKETHKKALQVLLRQQKKIAHSLSLWNGYTSSETSYAWKTVKLLETKITEVNSELEESRLIKMKIYNDLLFHIETNVDIE